VVNTLKTLSTKHKIHVDSSASAQYKNTPSPPTQAVRPAAQTQVAGAAAAESKALPFTGVSLLGTVLAGIALIGIGLVLRRRERSES
jgi:hypothetical protein